MNTPTNTPLTSEALAAKKAAIAQQQAIDNAAVTESETALHLLADKLHNAAFAAGKPQSFAASLQQAATDIIAKAGKDFPAAALANLQRYAPPSATRPGGVNTDPIAAAEKAAEAATA